MIVDSSAIMAILNEEPEAEACLAAIRATRQAKMSAATFLECALVVDGYGRVDLSADLEPMVERLGSPSFQSRLSTCDSVESPTNGSAAGPVIPLGSTAATVSPTPWPGTPANRCSHGRRLQPHRRSVGLPSWVGRGGLDPRLTGSCQGPVTDSTAARTAPVWTASTTASIWGLR